MSFKLLLLTIYSSLFLSFSSKAADKNYASFNTAVKVEVINNELEQAKSFDELHYVLLMMGDVMFKHYGDTCKVPKDIDYKALCLDIGTKAKAPIAEIEFYEYMYEKRILELACVNVRTDDEETVKSKVQKWWNKYKTKCKCDSLEFGLSNGNLLKLALSQNNPEAIETLTSTYGCDINFIDPADGFNLLDYIYKEISRLKKLGNSENIVRVYEEYKATVIGLGGKSNKN